MFFFGGSVFDPFVNILRIRAATREAGRKHEKAKLGFGEAADLSVAVWASLKLFFLSLALAFAYLGFA